MTATPTDIHHSLPILKLPFTHISRHVFKRFLNVNLGDCKRRFKSMKQKENIKEKLQIWTQSKTIRDKSGKMFHAHLRSDVYVDLRTKNDWWSVSDCDKNHFFTSLLRNNERIPMKELINGNEKIVLLRGIAGIGKTSFLDTLALKWANEEMYQEYDFLFKLHCRELNIWSQKRVLEEFEKIFTCLRDVKSKVLIIVDGMDEFKHLYNLCSKAKSKCECEVVSLLYDLIDSDYHQNKKVILAGRPKAIGTVHLMYENKMKCKLTEILGFDNQSIIEFVEKSFKHNNEKCELMKQRLTQMEQIRWMTQIPLYAKTLCDIHDSDELSEEINTYTKLLVSSCLVLLRNHMLKDQLFTFVTKVS